MSPPEMASGLMRQSLVPDLCRSSMRVSMRPVVTCQLLSRTDSRAWQRRLSTALATSATAAVGVPRVRFKLRRTPHDQASS